MEVRPARRAPLARRQPHNDDDQDHNHGHGGNDDKGGDELAVSDGAARHGLILGMFAALVYGAELFQAALGGLLLESLQPCRLPLLAVKPAVGLFLQAANQAVQGIQGAPAIRALHSAAPALGLTVGAEPEERAVAVLAELSAAGA